MTNIMKIQDILLGQRLHHKSYAYIIGHINRGIGMPDVYTSDDEPTDYGKISLKSGGGPRLDHLPEIQIDFDPAKCFIHTDAGAESFLDDFMSPIQNKNKSDPSSSNPLSFCPKYLDAKDQLRGRRKNFEKISLERLQRTRFLCVAQTL